MVFVSITVASLGFFDFPSKSGTLYQFSIILKSTIDVTFLAAGSVNEYQTFANVSLFCNTDWKCRHKPRVCFILSRRSLLLGLGYV